MKGARVAICLACGRVLLSWHRHDMRQCGCPNNAMIDGGRDYFRCGAADMGQLAVGELDGLELASTGEKLVFNGRE